MNLDRTQAMQALTYLVMAFFVGGGVVSARYRRRVRGVAIVLYGIGVALALVWVALWLFGVRD